MECTRLHIQIRFLRLLGAMATYECLVHTFQPTKKNKQDKWMSSKDDSAGCFRTRASRPMHEALQLHLNAAKLAIKVQDKRSQVGRLVFLVGQARMDGIGVHGGSRHRVRGRPDYTSPGIHYATSGFCNQATVPRQRAAITTPQVHDIDPMSGFLER